MSVYSWPESIEILCAQLSLRPVAKLITLLHRVPRNQILDGVVRHKRIVAIGPVPRAMEAAWGGPVPETRGSALQA